MLCPVSGVHLTEVNARPVHLPAVLGQSYLLFPGLSLHIINHVNGIDLTEFQ